MPSAIRPDELLPHDLVGLHARLIDDFRLGRQLLWSGVVARTLRNITRPTILPSRLFCSTLPPAVALNIGAGNAGLGRRACESAVRAE